MNLVRLISVLALSVGAVFATGCSAMYGAEFGATPGGTQDMGFARELIEAGSVPPPEAFAVEGMFSEHDLPLTGDTCEHELCLRTAMGIAPDEDEVNSTWLQVSFSSLINPETYERPTLTVVAVVDVSGSMTGVPLDVSKAMLNALIDELGANDRFGLVTYGGTVHTEVRVGDVDNRSRLHDRVNDLSTHGSTDMESGLERAFAQAIDEEGETDMRRVWLFTDAQPNVGATSSTSFERMAATAADEGVGLTVFGVGMGLGQELVLAMSHLRGGNSFSLFSEDDVDELMEESWPWMACPLAYDFTMEVRPADGLSLVESYGIPADDGSHVASLDVSTIFLSRNRGAILARFVPWSMDALDGEQQVEVDLSYTTVDGETVTDSSVASIESSFDGPSFGQPVVHKTVALAVLVRGMADAAELYGEDRTAAVAKMEQVHARIEADAEALDDPALEPEVQLAADLLELMRSGAPQGDRYSPSGY